MYINVLLRRFKLKSIQQSNIIKEKFTYEELKKWIINYVNKICEENFNIATKSWKKQIKIWQNNLNEYIENTEITNEQFEEYAKKLSSEKITIYRPRKLRDHYLTSNNNEILNDDATNKIKGKIGELGEMAVWRSLGQKYGWENIHIASKNDKFSPYDIIRYKKDGTKIYYEVKSTTSTNKMNFFLSRGEYDFYLKNKNNYSIVFVRGIDPYNINKDFLPPLIDEIKSPNIIIDLNKYGNLSNKDLIIMPISFKGSFAR